SEPSTSGRRNRRGRSEQHDQCCCCCPPGPIRCHGRSCRAAPARDWCSSAGSTTRRCGGNGNPCQTRGGGQCGGGRAAADGESAKGGREQSSGREQSDKPPRRSEARGASAPRRQDGPHPPNSRNGGGAASLSIWAVDLCAADLFAADLFATNLHVA